MGGDRPTLLAATGKSQAFPDPPQTACRWRCLFRWAGQSFAIRSQIAHNNFKGAQGQIELRVAVAIFVWRQGCEFFGCFPMLRIWPYYPRDPLHFSLIDDIGDRV